VPAFSVLACGESDLLSAGEIYAGLASAYDQAGTPVPVDFRSLVPGVAAHDRATHLVHHYPAKLLRHIPALFTSAPQLSRPGDLVMDPFCGSGTVLVEGLLAGRRVVGCDMNPLAVLLARVKTTPIPTSTLRSYIERLEHRIARRPSGHIPAEARLSYWFHPEVAQQLASIRTAIKATRRSDVRDFFDVCFSACVRRVSRADPRVSVPVRLKADQYNPDHWLYQSTRERLSGLRDTDVASVFGEVLRNNARRVGSLAIAGLTSSGRTVDGDARFLEESCKRQLDLPTGAVDLIITSPPYLSAQKYIRASSLGLLWLGYAPDGDLKPLTTTSVGREHFRNSELRSDSSTGIVAADRLIAGVRPSNPVRAHLATTYLSEMRLAIGGIARMLRPGGHLVLVVGGNTLCGQPFDTPMFLEYLANQSGLVTELVLVDTIRSRGLMTSRNRAASPITQETVLILQKAS
jgi:SAM-dependent methyltransferase